MTLVVNMFIAPCCVKEKLTLRDGLSTLVILSGTVLSLVFGSKSDHEYTLETLVDLYSQPLFIGYACFFVIYVAAMVVLLRYLTIKKRRRRHSFTPFDAKMERFAYPSLAGAFGAHSVLFAKSRSVGANARGFF